MTDDRIAPAGAGEEDPTPSRIPMTDQQLAAALTRHSIETRKLLGDQQKALSAIATGQTSAIEHLTDFLRANTPDRTWEQGHLRILGRLDNIVNMMAAPNTTAARVDAEDPSPHDVAVMDLSRQLRAERGSTTRLAWAAGLATLIVMPMVLALGILIQQQFTPLAMPDPTRGWKDRVWDRFGSEISMCISREITDNAECVLRATNPADAVTIDDGAASHIPYAITPRDPTTVNQTPMHDFDSLSPQN